MMHFFRNKLSNKKNSGYVDINMHRANTLYDNQKTRNITRFTLGSCGLLLFFFQDTFILLIRLLELTYMFDKNDN